MRALDDELPGAREALRAIYPHGRARLRRRRDGQPGRRQVDAGLRAGRRLPGAGRARRRRGGRSLEPLFGRRAAGRSGADAAATRSIAGVFIRSLATRGHHGGLSRATAATVAVLDAAGFPVILVETVGAGQAEVDVADAADAVVVVTAPGLGDEVQALKAGLLEIADLLVVNKGDREGADRTCADLTAMLALRRASGAAAPQDRRRDARRGSRSSCAALELLRGRPAAERAARRRRQAARRSAPSPAKQARARIEAAIAENGPSPRRSTPWPRARSIPGAPPTRSGRC